MTPSLEPKIVYHRKRTEEERNEFFSNAYTIYIVGSFLLTGMIYAFIELKWLGTVLVLKSVELMIFILLFHVSKFKRCVIKPKQNNDGWKQ